MIGWLVAWKCLVACLFLELSQQPTWPQVSHRRRWTQVSPIFRQSSQPFPLGVTSWRPRTWLQVSSILVLLIVGWCSPSWGSASRRPPPSTALADGWSLQRRPVPAAQIGPRRVGAVQEVEQQGARVVCLPDGIVGQQELPQLLIIRSAAGANRRVPQAGRFR